jgi:arachidonate 15-lipoxygenase
MQNYQIRDALLPKTFADRGVDHHDWLSSYAYRDDSMLYWSAIRHWVGDYLGLYYPSDAEVQADKELKAWAAEISGPRGGRITGLGRDGMVGNRNDLTDLVTFVLYTCSVQHAAVNFPQYDLMSYVPNMPLAGYAPAPTKKDGGTEADYLAMLPTLDMAELQMEMGYSLGTLHYTTLGQYGENHFDDPRVAAPLHAFQNRLAVIGGVIEDRNQTRWRRYDFLAPAGVPQSINV